MSARQRADQLLSLVRPGPVEVIDTDDALLLCWPAYTIHVLHEPEADPYQEANTPTADCFYVVQRFQPTPASRYFKDAQALRH